MPLIYEYNPGLVLKSLLEILDINKKPFEIQKPDETLPNRPPTLCPGCPHRATYYSVKKAAENLKLKDLIYPTDIGCYTLGFSEPYEAADYLLSMGSSIGTSCGFSKATEQPIVSFIGDSTFFHAGIPPLINAVHNKNRFVLVILDNRTTAMTGGQPHPGLPLDGLGREAPEISIKNLVSAAGVEFVKTIKPINIKKSVEIIEEALQYDGVAVVIAKYPCVLLKSRKKAKSEIRVDQVACDNCGDCLSTLACPAMFQEHDQVVIDTKLCQKCTVCVQTCPQQAIHGKKSKTEDH
jgi:indolepyruvate ferredoxin oxidoreductase alpha subunit